MKYFPLTNAVEREALETVEEVEAAETRVLERLRTEIAERGAALLMQVLRAYYCHNSKGLFLDLCVWSRRASSLEHC